MFELCASILAADFANLERDMRAANAAGVDAFHIDVMDGHFVPAISFGTGMVRTMERLTTKPLDVHLMVEKAAGFSAGTGGTGGKAGLGPLRDPGRAGSALRLSAPPGCKPGWYSTPKRRWNRPCRTWPKFRSCC